jgi:putative peptidoglycan lipid II flippase
MILAARRPPLGDAAAHVASVAPAHGAAGDSLTVAGWTVVSRVTGLVRIAATGAVLGPTLLGNTFQFTNTLPNLLYYGLLAGSLYSSLLVPALVPHVDRGDRGSAERLAGGFLGVTLLGLVVLVPLAVLLAPVTLGLTSPEQAGMAGPQQARLALLLFLMFVPQVFCYAFVGAASATMNAHGRFGLAAAAPALENVGIVAVLSVVAVLRHARPAGPDDVGPSELLLLGLGTAGAVAAHAALQWWGARRAGVTLRPLAGWRDPDVARILRRALPSLGQAGGLAVQVLVLLSLANGVAGGVVALQMALGFVYLAVAVGVTPIALATLPWLARLFVGSDGETFHDTFIRSVRLALFVAVPAAVGCLTLSPLLSRLVTAGGMATAAGAAMVSGPLAALATAIVGQAVFATCSYAFYARMDTRSPLLATLIQVCVCLLGATLALELLDGTRLLVGLGASYSAGTIAGATFMWRLLARRLVAGRERLLPSVLRTSCAALATVLPVWATARVLSSAWPAGAGEAVGALAAAAVGAGTFLTASRMLHAPEVAWLAQSVRRGARRLERLP